MTAMTDTPAKASGRLSQALIRLLMKRATVTASEALSDRFRLITLEGPALEGVGWVPGQKVQVAMGSAFVARTYTPIEWDAATGRTCLLGYAHGEGPGSAWVLAARPGDQCDLFGPRGSLDPRSLAGPLALFGDETSIGLAYALACPAYLEVNDATESSRVAAKLALAPPTLFERCADDSHLAELEATLPALAAAGASFVLTGKAGTIQRLRQALKRHAVPGSRILAKAYWAPGKTGLD
ncbi:siderophore-interacting protein [Sphingomonas sp.]|uniref:siderophore-interacting protein n=1 Tax=Sphingomonas sp. TaxID=28214 RepID=UPI001B2214C9|nr:siderophore-interacting protein [Sphingomonas sp.]MBO9714624.1 siderophore-interacting protein [Sphingomonas sp.]